MVSVSVCLSIGTTGEVAIFFSFSLPLCVCVCVCVCAHTHICDVHVCADDCIHRVYIP